jgi:hypothetical protein
MCNLELIETPAHILIGPISNIEVVICLEIVQDFEFVKLDYSMTI